MKTKAESPNMNGSTVHYLRKVIDVHLKRAMDYNLTQHQRDSSDLIAKHLAAAAAAMEKP